MTEHLTTIISSCLASSPVMKNILNSSIKKEKEQKINKNIIISLLKTIKSHFCFYHNVRIFIVNFLVFISIINGNKRSLTTGYKNKTYHANHLHKLYSNFPN
jgi:hypothetical protein